GKLAAMQTEIRLQTQETQRASTQQMGFAAEMASAQMTSRVQNLTNEALRRADISFSFYALLILLLACVAVGLLTILTAGTIVRPVGRLAQVARAIAQGDMEKRVDENAPDEVGDLAVAFNTMTASLQKSRAELNEAEAQLVHSAKLASLGTLSA